MSASQPIQPIQPSQRRAGPLVRLGERIPLRWRLALVVFGLLAALLLGLGALVSATVQSALLSNEAATLHVEARSAFNAAPRGAGPGFGAPQPHVPRGDAPTMPLGAPSQQFLANSDQLVARLSGPGTAVALLGSDGVVLAQSSDAATGLTAAPVSAAQVQAALAQPQQDQAYLLATGVDGRRQIVVLAPVVEGQQTVAALELSAPTQAIDSSVALIRVILFCGVAGSLALAALSALPLLRVTLRPLEEMERASRKIAAGDLTLRLREPAADDEIGRLARSYNVMVARLEGMLTRQQRFMADVSHELRTPLTAVAGSIEMFLLGAQGADTAAGARLLRSMYAETERMRRLVEELLTLARLDEGRLTLRIEAVDGGAIVRALCDEAQALTRGQALTCEVAPDLPPVRADADRLKQVLLIALDNALKFTPAGGSVTLSARLATTADAAETAEATDAAVIFTTRDTGVGIAPEDAAHVFDRFYRADLARARAQDRAGGAGLGLAIARSLVEAQGGAIALTSALGAGATVTIRLPLWQAPTTAPEPNNASR